MKREMKTLPDSVASKTVAKKVKWQKNDSQPGPNNSEECVASCSRSTKNSGKQHLNQPQQKQAIVPMDFSFLKNRCSYQKMIKNSGEHEPSDLTTLEHGTQTEAAGPSRFTPVKLSRKSLSQHFICRARLTPNISSHRQDVKPNKKEKNKTNRAVKVKRSLETRNLSKKSVTKSAKRQLKSADAPKSKRPRKTEKGKKTPQKIAKKIRPPRKDGCLPTKANLKEKLSSPKVSASQSPLKDTYNKPSNSKSENYESSTQKLTTTNLEPTEQETGSGSIKRLDELTNHTQMEIDDDTSKEFCSAGSQSTEQMDKNMQNTMHTAIEMENNGLKASISKSSESTEELNENIKMDVEDHEPKSASLKGPDSNKLLGSQLTEVEIKDDELKASSSNASSSNAQVEIKDGEIYPSCSESFDSITGLEEPN